MSSRQAKQLEAELEALKRTLSDPSEEPVKLSYPTIEIITEDFSEEIGRGGFGVVYLGYLPSGKIAVKKLSNAQDYDDKLFSDEINCLIRAKHRNIVRFLGYCAVTQLDLVKYGGKHVLADVRQRILCFEYVPNGNLYQYLKEKPNKNEWQMRYRLVKEIAAGLHCLHEERINHLDMKPENILLDSQMRPKITDFGLSRFFDEGQSRIFTKNVFGTRGYIAPEVLEKGELSFKSDVFSLGIIIIKLLTGRNNYDVDNWHKSLDVDGPHAECCIKIAQLCTHDDQHKRPTLGEIIDKLNTTESRKDTGSSVKKVSHGFIETELLDVYPLELSFPFKTNEDISSTLSLINQTGRQVGFLIVPDFSDRYCHTELLNGILMPMSTTAITVTMRQQKKQLLGTDKLEILMFIMGSESNRNIRKLMSSIYGVVNISTDNLVKQAEELGGKVHRAMLTVSLREATEFKFMDTSEESDAIDFISVHPTEPWILVIYADSCSIWNWKTGKKLSKKFGVFFSAQFIPRKKWLVLGDEKGSIFVFTCPALTKVKKFKAHNDRIFSMEVHPMQPMLLSCSEQSIKLWDWERGNNNDWHCNLFDEQDSLFEDAIFDRKDPQTFFTVGKDKIVKIWNIDSCKPITALKTLRLGGLFDYVLTNSDQYMIAAIQGWIVNICDLQTEKRIHSFSMHRKENTAISYMRNMVDLTGHPTCPILVTASDDGKICMWNSTTYRLEKYIQISEESPNDVGFIGSRSLAIAYDHGITIVDIDLE
ncbi:uncharacterized protein LOC124664274 [Lolium rigidum]|uniref:uncharacterized protein LOC124664274 n=1 Tax=Lolium rigidum TaxID=89674 RepID=UPI001F5C915E|nr:uncharacterized protein LOC124664274 [Lolium rigidum]